MAIAGGSLARDLKTLFEQPAPPSEFSWGLVRRMLDPNPLGTRNLNLVPTEGPTTGRTPELDAVIVRSERWPTGPCEDMFRHMSVHAPDQLLRAIEERELPAELLTFAAEAAAEISDTTGAVRSALLALLGHEASFVREGAIYGLTGHMNESVIRTLRQISRSDPSRTIREIALEVLDGV